MIDNKLFNTDLNGFLSQVKNNNIFYLGFLTLAVIIIIYYCYEKTNKFTNVKFTNVKSMHLNGKNGVCKGEIPKIDEIIIRNMIELPNRDPRMLTTSMVIPEITSSNEMQKQTRMEILNMFYNTFDDDTTSIKSRPQGMYLIP